MLGVWLSVIALIVVGYRRELSRLWREPVLGAPVLVVDSDDWGAGPLAQGEALRDIAAVLQRHRDATGRPAVWNLALVLAVPDGPAIASTGSYRRACLDAPAFAPVRDALRDGVARGVFALQLHGLEHYWPETLMRSPDEGVQAWLRQAEPAVTERLPSPLQSRWVDAGKLPSRPHAAVAVEGAVAEEVRAYTRVVGEPPSVVVPPTFVWTREVERAWAAHGVACIVNPGRRSTCRDADGRPAGDEGPLSNGDRDGALVYLVRNDYFEPSRGRDALHALAALDRAVAQGRPCLLENHRDNFIGEPGQRRASLAELDTLYREALRRHPGLRFLSTRELGRILLERPPVWLVVGAWQRAPFVWARIAATGRPWRLLRMTGAAALVGALLRVFAGARPAIAGHAGR
jgi:hypothetical protein